MCRFNRVFAECATRVCKWHTSSKVYRRNVFPEMNVQFGTYPNNVGHMDFPGCFRCHDENHATKDGKKIAQDCDTCHKIE
jgi:hypothetical protein